MGNHFGSSVLRYSSVWAAFVMGFALVFAVTSGLSAVDAADKSGKDKSSSAASTKPSRTSDKPYVPNNAAFDPGRVDSKGKTNVQRMQKGLAPIGTDKKPVQIHHEGQKNDGARIEVTATQHKQIKHSHDPSEINRPDFALERSRHWKDRAKDFDKK